VVVAAGIFAGGRYDHVVYNIDPRKAGIGLAPAMGVGDGGEKQGDHSIR
jgi:hypothetical protein